ncbi:hypothetical protein AZI86_14795 [Bdellovibrio bacteriovorus]|uniref:Transposase n=1 Tax=Bdellovibrio bacteriovorus TaxID=959 RepID=A0A150WJY4_BDEBC|nr:hypothetical protein AZI86_14795 [Bdellovibrio bacteriovorus]
MPRVGSRLLQEMLVYRGRKGFIRANNLFLEGISYILKVKKPRLRHLIHRWTKKVELTVLPRIKAVCLLMQKRCFSATFSFEKSALAEPRQSPH